MTQQQYKEQTARLPIKQLCTHTQIVENKYKFPKSTKRDDIIEWIMYTNFVDNYTIQLAGDDDTTVDDVIQDIYLTLLEKTQEDWDKLTRQGLSTIRAYISGLIYRQVKSANSPSYYQYRRYNQRRISLDDQSVADKIAYIENEK